jgi:hypothetical protein
MSNRARAGRVLTRHPEPGKQGVHIERAKYDRIRQVILETVRARQPIAFQELNREVKRRLTGSFDGSIPWYVATVKLDLEAGGQLRRVPGSRPQLLRLP